MRSQVMGAPNETRRTEQHETRRPPRRGRLQVRLRKRAPVAKGPSAF